MGIEFFIGAIVGALVQAILIFLYILIFCRHGVFKIDLTDPNKDICRLEIGSIEDIYKKRTLILRVDKKTDLSQK